MRNSTGAIAIASYCLRLPLLRALDCQSSRLNLPVAASSARIFPLFGKRMAAPADSWSWGRMLKNNLRGRLSQVFENVARFRLVCRIFRQPVSQNNTYGFTSGSLPPQGTHRKCRPYREALSQAMNPRLQIRCQPLHITPRDCHTIVISPDQLVSGQIEVQNEQYDEQTGVARGHSG